MATVYGLRDLADAALDAGLSHILLWHLGQQSGRCGTRGNQVNKQRRQRSPVTVGKSDVFIALDIIIMIEHSASV